MKSCRKAIAVVADQVEEGCGCEEAESAESLIAAQEIPRRKAEVIQRLMYLAVRQQMEAGLAAPRKAQNAPLIEHSHHGMVVVRRVIVGDTEKQHLDEKAHLLQEGRIQVLPWRKYCWLVRWQRTLQTELVSKCVAEGTSAKALAAYHQYPS